ncbi:MAG: polysaccharide deacetylase family protein [Myxococcales bacterium FL481]|nr:MAG: polysaccharide deacetylase family protein [Myxococcales bacterium FL481]
MWRTIRPFVRDGIVGFGARAGWSAPRQAAGKLTIATFHRVLPAERRNEYPMPELVVTPDELDWCLGLFTTNYTCQTLTRSYAELDDDKRGRPRLAVTFDDGQLDNLEFALPVLARHRVHATFYVVADAVGQAEPLWHDRVAYAWPPPGSTDEARALRLVTDAGVAISASETPTPMLPRLLAGLKRMPPARAEEVAQRLESAFGTRRPEWDRLMDWSQVRCVAGAGHEIGAHSSTHAILTNCDDARLEHETAGAKTTIESQIDRPVPAFCYPNGDHDGRVVRHVQAAGFSNAVTTQFGVNPPHLAPFRLRRCDIQSATSRDARGELSPQRLAWRLAALPGSG